MKKMIISCFMTLCFLLISLSPVFAGTIVLTLDKKTDYLRQGGFTSGTYTAFTLIWSGDVNYLGSKIGEFTTSETKTTYTGINGTIMNYDIIIPAQGGIGDFVSVRANHITTGSGSDKGTVYATSPSLKAFIGSTVTIDGNAMTINY
jgi:hypothetical protein